MFKLQNTLEVVPEKSESGLEDENPPLPTEGCQLDAIIVKIGQFGRFQITNYLLLCLPIICNAFYSISYVFTASEVAYRCNITQCDTLESSYDEPFLNFTTPQRHGVWDHCEHYAFRPDLEAVLHHYLGADPCNNRSFDVGQRLSCDSGFILRQDEKTIASEFGIFCSERWKLSMVGTVNNIGQFIGRALGGRIALCCFVWLIHTLIALGLSIHSGALNGSKFENFSMTGFMQVPGILLGTFLMHWIGRRWALTSCQFTCATLILAVAATDEGELPQISSILFFLAKMISTGSFMIVYFFTSEIFPTNCRNSLLSFCSCMGRFGSMLAPQTTLLIDYYEYAPHLLFALFGFTCSGLSLFFPETSNKVLPTTLEEAKALDRSMPGAKSKSEKKSAE
ncbi:putative transporter B0252.3 isoform X2 [Drosophila serrata]|uniref:putative transporter B0252.3 isoform X2 n=1 Tax=Drosophila serrata TaxID=7274 RepID=UPI000A1D3208|nr:putative transporter B0252.3 isoform X2 [Drosophila serrata]